MPESHPSPAQLAANRANAAASTGPRSLEGKRIAALNATRHGILASQLHFESDEEDLLYRTLWARLVSALEPTDMVESILVERMAMAYWRLRRVVSAETRAIAAAPRSPDGSPPLLPSPEHLELFSRYEVTLERQLYRALEALDRRRDRLFPRQRRAACVALLHESAEELVARQLSLTARQPAPQEPAPVDTPSPPSPSAPPCPPSTSSPADWDEIFRSFLSALKPVLPNEPIPPPLGVLGCGESPSGAELCSDPCASPGAVLPNEPNSLPPRERSP